MNDAAGPTVLLVDDSRTVRLMGARLLQSLGYRVIQAESGYEALAVLRTKSQVDAVITDVVMPQLSGVAFVRIASQLIAVPIIAVTVEQSPQMRDALLAAGAHAVLGKPLTRRALAAVLSASTPEAPPSGCPKTDR